MEIHRPIRFALALLVAGAGAASAQEPEPDTLRSDQEGVLIGGQVADRTSQAPVPSASVELLDLGDDRRRAWRGMSDSTGYFRGPRLQPSTYEIRVEALGYDPLTHTISVSGYGRADLMIELSPDALELEPLVVVSRRRSRLETAGFYDRRERGFGHSMTREEIEASHALQISDLVRTIPGVSISPGYMGSGGILRMRGGCVPDVILDGVRMTDPVRLDDLLSVSDLEGIEVYTGATSPMQYSHSSCGTVLAWTRDPGAGDGSPFSWKRAGVAAGFLLLGLLLSG